MKLAISVAVFLFDSSRRALAGFLGIPLRGTCVVVYYHAVTAGEQESFGRQMDEVLRRCLPIGVGSKPELKPGLSYLGITFDDGFQCILHHAIPELLRRNIPATVFVPSGCLGRLPVWLKDKAHRDSNELVMTADELLQLSRNPLITIGSHCVFHENLLMLGEEEAQREIRASKDELEAIIGKEITSLSFPHGAFNESHKKMAIEAGYTHIFSISPHLAFLKHQEPIIGRVKVDASDFPLEFRLKILGAYRWLPMASCLKQKILTLEGPWRAAVSSSGITGPTHN